MEDAVIFALFAGIKVSVFVVLFVLSVLVEMASRKRRATHGLNVMAFCLMAAAVIDFFFIMANIHEGMPAWLADQEIVKNGTQILAAVAGLGLIWYTLGVSRNIKDYR